MTRQRLTERLETSVEDHFDVIVAGGGPAGIPAAVAAARNGSRVLLVETNGCLGGVWTAGILTFVWDIDKSGIGHEIIDGLRHRNAYEEVVRRDMIDFTYDVESMKLVVDNLITDAGVEVLLHTRVVSSTVDDDGALTAIITESKSGRQAWTADVFIDCTGDGDLGARSGNGFDLGSEAEGATQPGTYMGLVVVRDLEPVIPFISFYGGQWNHGAKYGGAMSGFRRHLSELGLDPSYGNPTLFQVRDNLLAVMVNHQYNLDATSARSVTDATMSARREVNAIVDTLARDSAAFRNCVLASTAEHIGIREGRRLHGRYRVTENDIRSGARFDDAVCRVRFNADVHSTSVKQGKGLVATPVQAYDIPVRALIARDVDGLMMAGRCISGDWIAHASYRVTGEAVAMGEAAGTLAAVASRTKRMPHEVEWSDVKPLLPEIRDHYVEPVDTSGRG